jgi:cell wall-associated NlpC family hydrolase
MMNAMKKYAIPLVPLLALLLGGAAGGVTDDELRGRIISTAKKYIGARYRYGSQGPGGFDCSGFVQYVFRENGIALPRSTVDQFEKGRKIELAAARPGDLVFFRIYRRRVSHVGIYAGASTFIHAPTWGKRVGFADMNLAYWRNTFAGAVTYIGGGNAPPAPAAGK